MRLIVTEKPSVAQYERFEDYFKRGNVEEFEFRGKEFNIYITEVVSFPQAFAAAMPVYGAISFLPKVMVIDIGGFTVDYLLVKNGQVQYNGQKLLAFLRQGLVFEVAIVYNEM